MVIVESVKSILVVSVMALYSFQATGVTVGKGADASTIDEVLDDWEVNQANYILLQELGNKFASKFICKGISDAMIEKLYAMSDTSIPKSNCVGINYHGNFGDYDISSDGRFVYIQDWANYGNPSFHLVDVVNLRIVSGIKKPSGVGPSSHFMSFGPDSRVLMLVAEDGKLWVYDRLNDREWSFRDTATLPIGGGLVSFGPVVDHTGVVLWRSSGEIGLYDLRSKVDRWTVTSSGLNLNPRDQKSAHTGEISPSEQDCGSIIPSDNGNWLLAVAPRESRVIQTQTGKTKGQISSANWRPMGTSYDPGESANCYLGEKTEIDDDGNGFVEGTNEDLKNIP